MCAGQEGQKAQPRSDLRAAGEGTAAGSLSDHSLPPVDSREEALVDQAIASELQTRQRHIAQGRDRRILSDSEIHSLKGPIVVRMRAGMLSQAELLSFTNAVAHGGVPLEELMKSPLMVIEEGLHTTPLGQDWLPHYLTERVIDRNELGINQGRIVTIMQSLMSESGFDLPVFFIGSAARRGEENPTDIDIGTSSYIRHAAMKRCDDFFSSLRQRVNEPNANVLGRKQHVGFVTDVMVQALAVSAHRYERALRICQTEVLAIERVASTP